MTRPQEDPSSGGPGRSSGVPVKLARRGGVCFALLDQSVTGGLHPVDYPRLNKTKEVEERASSSYSVSINTISRSKRSSPE